MCPDDPRPDSPPPRLTSDTRQAGWRRANPAKYLAHLAVQKALAAGTLTRLSCEVCGSDTVDAHHDRYDRPLQVRWLCRRHHVRLHTCGEDMFPLRDPVPGLTDDRAR